MPASRGLAGVPLDDFVWEHSSDRDCNAKESKEEAQPSTRPDGVVRDLLRTDDHADR